MGLRGRVKRLERSAREDLSSFVLEDGSRHYFNPTSGECFLHALACMRAGSEGEPFPEPPPTIKALTRARDRAGALDVAGGGVFGSFPYEREPFIARGELVPASWIKPIEDLSE